MQTIQIFLKAPITGTVKTRLAHSVGDDEALKTYRALVIRQLNALPSDKSVEIHFTPAQHEAMMRSWLGDRYAYYAQCEGDLTDRLTSAVGGAFTRGSERVFCIGGDCPALNTAQIAEASAKLTSSDAIAFGPTEDGGYYLIGMRSSHTEVFEGIPWSSAETLSTSVKQAKALGLEVHLLETLYDVDTIQELERARADGLI